MSNYQEGKILGQFMDLTQMNQAESLRMLKACKWDLGVALNTIFADEQQPTTQSTTNKEHIKALFNKYKDAGKKDLISIDGTLQICQDLDIEPTQLEFLLLSEQLGSEIMGEFTRERFIGGCSQINVDSIESLKNALNTTLKDRFQTEEGFRKTYTYAFLLGRQTGQKSLSLEAATELWRLLLTYRFSLLDEWIDFLEKKHNKAISRDTWNLFLDFTTQKNLDIQSYDSEGAWPILIDEFVDHMKEQQL